MQCQTIDVEDHLNRTLTEVDLAQSGWTYWEQKECLILDRFIPKEIVNPCLTEVERLRRNIHRNYVPGHKQGGSISYHAILNESHESSAIITLYRSPAVRLSIAIPEAQVVDAPALLRLVRMAPTCDIEADEHGALYVALFEDFPKSAETVARLIEEAWDLDDVRILLEERPVASRINFYIALRCYHESLGAPDAVAYCLQQSAKVGSDGGCPDRSCVSHCQFICSRCVGLSGDRPAGSIQIQLMELARQAEVDWCPNLHIEKVNA